MAETRTYALKCPNCGAPLQVRAEIETFACAHCGTSVAVENSGGIVSLRVLARSVGRIERNTDRTASELAIVRIKEELKDLAARKADAADSRDQAFRDWCRRIEKEQSQSVGSTVLIAGFAAGIVASFVHQALFWIAGIATMIFVYSSLSSKRDARVAEMGKQRDAEMRQHEGRVADLETEMAATQGRLETHKKIVDG